jgi:hypothetical protein
MDPSRGGFVSQDTYMGRSNDPASLHKYSYVHQNPTNMIDPSGNISLGGIVAGIGAGISFAISAVSIYSRYIEPFLIDEESEVPTVYDLMMSVLVKHAVVDLSVTSGTFSAVTSDKYEKHHVVPVYMCGINSNIQICSIPKPAHDEIHRQLDGAVETVEVLGKVVALSLRRQRNKRETTIMRLLGRTEPGRAAIIGLLTQFYASGSWKGTPYFSLGSPTSDKTIGKVFGDYAPIFVADRKKTSWRKCKR